MRSFFAFKDRYDIGNLSARELLCVSENATREEIKSNYLNLARVTHSDKNGDKNAKLFKLITKAKDELLGHSSGDDTLDYDQQMEMVLEPFSQVLNKSKYGEIVHLLEALPQNAAQIAAGYDISKLYHLIRIAENFGLEGMIRAYKKALESNFTCKKCKKQMELNDICYCFEAQNKCHCNVRKCCSMKPEECGRFF